MSRPAMAIFAFGLLLAAGCAPPLPFAPPPATPTRQLPAEALVQNLWTGGSRSWTIRQTALFELHGRKLPIAGLLRLDTGRRQARLVGLNDLGVKLFDLGVTLEGHEEHYLLPELAGIPGVGGAIAGAVRHIFLAPRPAPTDALQIGATEYRLMRRTGDNQVLFVFAGSGPDLVETRVAGDGEDWRVRYFDYRPAAGTTVPGGILLEDARGNYRLTLWLEEARTHDD